MLHFRLAGAVQEVPVVVAGLNEAGCRLASTRELEPTAIARAAR